MVWDAPVGELRPLPGGVLWPVRESATSEGFTGEGFALAGALAGFVGEGFALEGVLGEGSELEDFVGEGFVLEGLLPGGEFPGISGVVSVGAESDMATV